MKALVVAARATKAATSDLIMLRIPLGEVIEGVGLQSTTAPLQIIVAEVSAYLGTRRYLG